LDVEIMVPAKMATITTTAVQKLIIFSLR